MEQITTKDQLKRRLNIKNLSELKNQKVIEHFRGIAQFVTPELFTELLRAAPEIAKAFTHYLATLNSFGQEIENSKQQRWKCLMKAIETNQMNGDQILEAIQLLGGMDSRDSEAYMEHSKEQHKSVSKTRKILERTGKAIGAAILVVGGVFLKNYLDKDDNGPSKA